MARQLFVDVDNSRLVGGLNNASAPTLDNLFEADNVDYELYFVRETGAARPFYRYADFSGAGVKLHIGAPPPSAATAYVAAEGWSNLGSAGIASVARTVTGGATANEQQRLAFSLAPENGTFALTFPSQSVSFSALSAGVFTTSGAHGFSTLQPFVVTGFTIPSGFINGQVLTVAQVIDANRFFAAASVTTTAVTGFSATGVGSAAAFTITATTSFLTHDASTTAVESALSNLRAIGEGNVSVTGQAGKSYAISFGREKANVALPLMTVVDALNAPLGKTATVNFNTVELANAISASATLDAVMEIETTEGGKTQTVLQVPVTLRNDLIATGSPLPVSTTTASPFALLNSPDNSVWAISVDDNGILTSEKIA